MKIGQSAFSSSKQRAPVSASTVARLKEKWHAELAEWRQRPLDDLEVVYMWVDGAEEDTANTTAR